MTRLKYAILATPLIIAYMLLMLWFWDSTRPLIPYERPPELTPQEERVIDKAKGKHGREIRVRYDNYRIYFVRDGREILIARRG
ncbi:MAG: hypothetical protein ACYDG4_13385 [Desulfuromonadaceae bacterium]